MTGRRTYTSMVTRLQLLATMAVLSKGLCRDVTTVSTPVGQIVGFMDKVNVHGKSENVRKFLGIPFAEPPIGNLRFAKPVPKQGFQVPFRAHALGPNCIELRESSNITMSEDCLFLNIYSPEREAGSETFPVIVWIHGGGYARVRPKEYPGDYFSVAGQVVLVTINYRLATFGFLSAMDDDIPGNYGLWDQQLALKWVHDNIASFGGDPNRVTIFGESAGSESVNFHLLNPINLGLFQRAICESGSATAEWAMLTPSRAKETAKNFAAAIGCARPSSAETLQCLRVMTTAEITKTMDADNVVPYAWIPVMDGDYIPDIPEKIMDGTSKKTASKEMFNSVDLVIGFNSLEGAIEAEAWLRLLNQSDIRNFTVTKAEFEDIFVPYYVDAYYRTKTPDIAKEVVRSEYTDWSDPNDGDKRLKMLADLVADIEVTVPSVDVADGHRRFSRKSTYMYEFAVSKYPDHYNAMPKVLDGPEVANHADELFYILRQDGEPTDKDEAARVAGLDIGQMAIYLRVSTAMITMWTNFAKTGDPNKPVDVTAITNVIWPQYGTEESYLKITSEMTSQSVQQRVVPKAVDIFKNVLPAVMNATKCSQCQTSGISGIIVG